MKKILFFLILLYPLTWFQIYAMEEPAAYKTSPISRPDDITSSQSKKWVEMPAGAKPSYVGIHGGTMPVSLLVSSDGSSLLGFAGKTGNDFLEVLRHAYLPFPSFANATREKFHTFFSSTEKGRLFAGNATASMPVINITQAPGINPEWISHFQPFGLSDQPLSIEGNVSKPEVLPAQKKYRIFFLPEKFFTPAR